MQDYQREFIQLALNKQVLRFGEFTLKSGRISPYFFNAGLFNTGAALAQLGRYYAAAIQAANLQYDVLFGPAYKGIPLASATSIALAGNYKKDVPYCFNRKEIKEHGEGGSLVGAPLKGRILIIDDVITAGTAVQESITIISQAGATLAGVVVALDRQERGQNQQSTIQEIASRYQVPVVSIIQLEHLIEYLYQQPEFAAIQKRLEDYRSNYGI